MINTILNLYLFLFCTLILLASIIIFPISKKTYGRLYRSLTALPARAISIMLALFVPPLLLLKVIVGPFPYASLREFTILVIGFYIVTVIVLTMHHCHLAHKYKDSLDEDSSSC